MWSAENIIAALNEINRCLVSEDVDHKILDVLARLFQFDYLLLSVKVQREGEIWFEGQYGGGQCPEGLVKATKRQCTGNNTTDDILCWVAGQKRIVRVDPQNPHDPLLHKLHPETVKKFHYSDPIYFIPLLDRANEVQAVIHASRPRAQDKSADSEFVKSLAIIANNAGIAIENARLHRQLDRLARQRELLVRIGATIESLANLDEKYYLLMTGITCEAGLGYNRAFLFLQNMTGQYKGVWGIAAKDLSHFRKIGKAASEWKWEDYLDAFKKEPAQYEWPNELLRELILEVAPGSPIHDCIESLTVKIFDGNLPMDNAIRDEKYSSLFIKDAQYALVPIKGSGSCIGILYLDNAFTRQNIHDVAGLTLLGLQLSSVVESARRVQQQLAIKDAFATLMHRVGTFISDTNDSKELLFSAIDEAARVLGAKRSCVAIEGSAEIPWNIAHRSINDKVDDSIWLDAVIAATKAKTPDGIASEHGMISSSSNRQRILVAFMPFDFETEKYAICMEVLPTVAIDLAYLQTWGTLAVFASAVLAISERSYYQSTNLAEILDGKQKLFAVNLYRLTAHEARNVLSALFAVVERINASPLRLPNREKQQLLDLEKRINAGVAALDTYVTFLDDFDKDDSKAPEWTAVGAVINQVIVLLSPRIVALGKNPQSVIKREIEPSEVMMDHTNFTIVIHNLLSNAIKAVKDTSDPEIMIRAKLAASKLTITITDNGCGVSADERPLIFSSRYSGFARRNRVGASVATSPYKSSGIGLFGTRILVAEHGGKIYLNAIGGKTEAMFVLTGRRSERK